jgi:hypothetical protein
MARGLLFALPMMCASGCLWPTSLTDAVQSGGNVRPVFVDSLTTPHFGEILSAPGAFLPLTLYAEDPNPDVGDVLHVREFVFTVGDTQRRYAGFEITLTHIATPANTYTGSFQAFDLCGVYHDGAEVFVVVSDAEFKPVGMGMDDKSDGLTSENHWQLKCQ